MITRKKIIVYLGILSLSIVCTACIGPSAIKRSENKNAPASYNGSKDSINTATIKWKTFFKDQYLIALIDTALKNNQELNIINRTICVSFHMSALTEQLLRRCTMYRRIRWQRHCCLHSPSWSSATSLSWVRD